MPYLDAVLYLLGITREEVEEADAAEPASTAGDASIHPPAAGPQPRGHGERLEGHPGARQVGPGRDEAEHRHAPGREPVGQRLERASVRAAPGQAQRGDARGGFVADDDAAVRTSSGVRGGELDDARRRPRSYSSVEVAAGTGATEPRTISQVCAAPGSPSSRA